MVVENKNYVELNKALKSKIIKEISIRFGNIIIQFSDNSYLDIDTTNDKKMKISTWDSSSIDFPTLAIILTKELELPTIHNLKFVE